MQQELDVLIAIINAKQASEREEHKCCNDDRWKRSDVVFIQSC